jgi:hypothetical protein
MNAAVNPIKRKLPFTGALFGIFFIVVTLDSLYITDANYALLSQIRLYSTFLLGGLALAFLFYIIFFSSPSKALLYYSCVHLLLILYGLLLSLTFGGADYFFDDPKLLLYLLVSLGFGQAMVSHFLSHLGPDRTRISGLLPAYFYVSLLYLGLSGALLLGPLPYFNFDQLDQVDRNYSHATSALFGIASLYFLLASYDKPPSNRLVLTLVSLICLYLSAMGGARGDFAIALILYAVILIRHRSVYSYLFISGLAGLVIYILSDDEILQKLLIVQRYLSIVETGDFGERDVLVAQSISLLADKPACIIGGCGFNYFQYFYNYEYGLYPHNFAMELVITFGLLLALPLFLYILFGAWRLFTDPRADRFFFYFSMYVLLVALKSGSLIDFKSFPVILFLAFVPYFFKAAGSPDGLLAATPPHTWKAERPRV